MWESIRPTKDNIVQVEVNMIRSDWLFQKIGRSDNKGNDFLKFIDHLDSMANNESLYTTTFIDSLLKPLW